MALLVSLIDENLIYLAINKVALLSRFSTNQQLAIVAVTAIYIYYRFHHNA